MKLLLLADSKSSHTKKWVHALANRGLTILLFTLGEDDNSYEDEKSVEVVALNQTITRIEGSCSKIKYVRALPLLKKLIKKFRPDILHAHYATSYGFLGALSGFHPYILSIWGSDVFSFPHKSILHRNMLKFNLSKADTLLSTSHVMAEEAGKYTHKPIEVIAFGVNTDIFRPLPDDSAGKVNEVTIGTVKLLEEIYGINYLIKAFHIITTRHPELPLKLLIVGGGTHALQLKSLVNELSLEEQTTFTGSVPHNEVARYHNMLDISVSVSESESFGVAVIEASACEKPVVVSDVGGLPEVVKNGVTGIVVPPQSPTATADAIEMLVFDKELRKEMGKAGRKRVKKHYDWTQNTQQMLDIYEKVCNSTSK